MKLILFCLFLCLVCCDSKGVIFDDLSLKLCNKDKDQRRWTIHGKFNYSVEKTGSLCIVRLMNIFDRLVA